jgi:nitroimidazol reductase NimA-like FMN-containing flavoprotein (pyridoxamine 5'-phosphate oxidase superfamily)
LSEIEQNLKEQAAKVGHITLGTVDENGYPAQRTLASFAVAGETVYFSTSAQSRKISHLRARPQVSVLFQQDGQQLGVFVNLAVTGRASVITDPVEFQKAGSFIAARSPRFKDRWEKGQVGAETALVKVEPVELRWTDLSKGPGPASVTVIAKT